MSNMDLTVEQLGPARFDSPLLARLGRQAGPMDFVDDRRRLCWNMYTDGAPRETDLSFEQAGPRRQIYFDPPHARAAIVTCGGLCPGLNDVIRALVMSLHYWYGIGEVLGVPYGYQGLAAGAQPAPYPLRAQDVEDVHQRGGTILGSSRGAPPVEEMVDTLVRLNVNILFCIGGDGTLRGAHAIDIEARRRGLKIAVAGIPKTIDNDIELVYRSFGFQTAVEEACKVLDCAHVEAKGARGGVGLVKLMGRDSGFIAAHGTLASGDVNYCLVPEVPFALEGEHGLLEQLRARLRARKHAVIAVAEGAGAALPGAGDRRDASGNVLHPDVGLFLKEAIERAFAGWGEEVHIKYFDPSYTIRSVSANANDSIFCSDLARCAANAAMAGRTGLMIGQWHGVFTHVPLAAIAGLRRRIDPQGKLWRAVQAATGQPDLIN
jgi:6-phosphofructokinase 1